MLTEATKKKLIQEARKALANPYPKDTPTILINNYGEENILSLKEMISYPWPKE